METPEEFISQIKPIKSNFDYCVEKNKINGSLFTDIKNALINYHEQFNTEIEEKRRNNSTLSEIDCYIRLTGDRPFEGMGNDDLDSIYAVAFKRWAHHLTRRGYIDALNKKRIELRDNIIN